MTTLLIIVVGAICSLTGLIGSFLVLKLIFALMGHSIDDGNEFLET